MMTAQQIIIIGRSQIIDQKDSHVCEGRGSELQVLQVWSFRNRQRTQVMLRGQLSLQIESAFAFSGVCHPFPCFRVKIKNAILQQRFEAFHIIINEGLVNSANCIDICNSRESKPNDKNQTKKNLHDPTKSKILFIWTSYGLLFFEDKDARTSGGERTKNEKENKKKERKQKAKNRPLNVSAIFDGFLASFALHVQKQKQ